MKFLSKQIDTNHPNKIGYQFGYLPAFYFAIKFIINYLYFIFESLLHCKVKALCVAQGIFISKRIELALGAEKLKRSLSEARKGFWFDTPHPRDH